MCPTADAESVTICGRILDVGTNQPVDGSGLEVLPYDALEFAQNPGGLMHEERYVDSCGRFRVANVVRPSLGFVALSVDDIGGADVHGRAAIVVSPAAGETLSGERLYAIRHGLDGAWTDAAGLDGGSFVERGAILAIFSDPGGDPMPGVTVTENGAAEVANDYYFADADPSTRTTVDPVAAQSGANGSALKIDSQLSEHAGTIGGSPLCDSALAVTIPGVLLVAPRRCVPTLTAAPPEICVDGVCEPRRLPLVVRGYRIERVLPETP